MFVECIRSVGTFDSMGCAEKAPYNGNITVILYQITVVSIYYLHTNRFIILYRFIVCAYV